VVIFHCQEPQPPIKLNFQSHQVHRYPGLYTARVRNLYRVSPYQSSFRGPWVINSSMRNHEEYDTSKIEKSILFLVNDICGAVPFLVGLRTFALIVQTKRLLFRIPCFHYQGAMLVNISIRDDGDDYTVTYYSRGIAGPLDFQQSKP
jgi:hypothetical protein